MKKTQQIQLTIENGPRHFGGCFEGHQFCHFDLAFHEAFHFTVCAFDVAFDDALGAHHQATFGHNVAFKRAVDTHVAHALDVAFEDRSFDNAVHRIRAWGVHAHGGFLVANHLAERYCSEKNFKYPRMSLFLNNVT